MRAHNSSPVQPLRVSVFDAKHIALRSPRFATFRQFQRQDAGRRNLQRLLVDVVPYAWRRSRRHTRRISAGRHAIPGIPLRLFGGGAARDRIFGKGSCGEFRDAWRDIFLQRRRRVPESWARKALRVIHADRESHGSIPIPCAHNCWRRNGG